MQKSLTRIQQQIEKLQRQATDLRSREAAQVIKKIKVAIEHYDLTAEDLFGGRGKRAPKAPNGNGHAKATTKRGAAQKRAPVAVKYRDGEGNTWTGRGSQPRWLLAHLKSGRKIGDFAVATH
jgi:DNA-binding protein H-NS